MGVNPGDGLMAQETVDGISGVGQMKSETDVVPYEFYAVGYLKEFEAKEETISLFDVI